MLNNQKRTVADGDAGRTIQMFIAHAQRIIRGELGIVKLIFESFNRNAMRLMTQTEDAHKRSGRTAGECKSGIGKGIGVVIQRGHAYRSAHAAYAAHALPVGQKMIHPSAAAAVQRKIAISHSPSI